jgi:hypothetical protein
MFERFSKLIWQGWYQHKEMCDADMHANGVPLIRHKCFEYMLAVMLAAFQYHYLLAFVELFKYHLLIIKLERTPMNTCKVP